MEKETNEEAFVKGFNAGYKKSLRGRYRYVYGKNFSNERTLVSYVTERILYDGY